MCSNDINCFLYKVDIFTDLNHFLSCSAVSLGSAWQDQEHEGKDGKDQTAPRSHELCCTSPFPSPHLARGRREKREGGGEGGREEGREGGRRKREETKEKREE